MSSLNLPCISLYMSSGRVSPGYLSIGSLKALDVIKQYVSW